MRDKNNIYILGAALWIYVLNFATMYTVSMGISGLFRHFSDLFLVFREQNRPEPSCDFTMRYWYLLTHCLPNRCYCSLHGKRKTLLSLHTMSQLLAQNLSLRNNTTLFLSCSRTNIKTSSNMDLHNNRGSDACPLDPLFADRNLTKK